MSIYDFFSLLIALIALGVSIYSVYQTNKANKYELLITDAEHEPFHGMNRMHFHVYNNSPKSITIHSIVLNEFKTGEQLEPLSFDVQNFYKKEQEQKLQEQMNQGSFLDQIVKPLFSSNVIPPSIDSCEYTSDLSNILISPYQGEWFNVYLDKMTNVLNITIHTNQKLNRFSCKKTFSVKFSQSN